MRLKAFAVIDTNVVVSSIISDCGFPAKVLGFIKEGNIIPIFDERILDEYYQVLHYTKFIGKISEQNIYDTMHIIVENGIFINDIEQARIELKDKGDIPFFEVKESSEDLESYLVTGNKKHFPESNTTITPQVMLCIMKELDKLMRIMEGQQKYGSEYEQSVEEIIRQKLSTQKYTSGKELLSEMFDSKTKSIKIPTKRDEPDDR